MDSRRDTGSVARMGTVGDPQLGVAHGGPLRPRRSLLRPRMGDLSGAVADLGTFVPLVAALVLVNGLEPGPLLIIAGLLSLAAGLWFGVPFPVQPLKALTALAVAQALSPDTIRAAGLLIGLVLVTLSLTGLVERIAVVFTRPVIRALQLAVGILLVRTALRLAADPPALFVSAPPPATSVLLAVLTVVGVAIAVRRAWYAAVVVVVTLGALAAWVGADPVLGAPRVVVPSFALPPVGVWWTAFVLLVIPQLPLTYGNAIVGMADLARERFPDATRVRPGTVALSCGLGNVGAALLGGMPMCHGSSGFSAHVRLGARTSAMNVLLGSSLLLLGLVFSDQVLVLFGLLPVWALAGFLAYAGLRHAMLALDLRGRARIVAIVAALAGILTGNLAITTAIALGADWLPRATGHRRARLAERTEGEGIHAS
jgi:sulfate permease, SulP family